MHKNTFLQLSWITDLVIANIWHISPKGIPPPCSCVDLATILLCANSWISTHPGLVLDPLCTSKAQKYFSNTIMNPWTGHCQDLTHQSERIPPRCSCLDLAPIFTFVCQLLDFHLSRSGSRPPMYLKSTKVFLYYYLVSLIWSLPRFDTSVRKDSRRCAVALT